MNFQERFKGKTSQMSKDPTASIIDTSERMKVDFNNMKPCDVFEITRSYTPSVKSEVDVPTRNSYNVQQLSTTDKGQFRRPQKTMSQKALSNQDIKNSAGSEYARTQQSIFSILQNNFDNNDTIISDICSPINLKKQIMQKQMEKSRFQETPPQIMKLVATPQYSGYQDNSPNSLSLLEKSNSLQLQKLKSEQSPLQPYQSKLTKERSSSNNFQRVGSILARSLPQQPNLTEPSHQNKIGNDIFNNKDNTPYNKNQKMQTEEGESHQIRNFTDANNASKNMMINSFRSKNIENNLISTNKNVVKQMTEHGFTIQTNNNNLDNSLYRNDSINSTNNNGNNPNNTNNFSKMKQSSHISQPSLQVSKAQEEYFQNYGLPSGGFIEMTQSDNNNSNNNTRRIKSHLGFNDSLRKITPHIPDGKQQEALEDLEQFINGLNNHANIYSSSTSTALSATHNSNMGNNNNQNININNNNNKILQNQQLWMNKQLSQIVPADSLQNQINQLQMKKEEEQALVAYKNQFNYKQMNTKRLNGNNSPQMSSQYSDSNSQNNFKKINININSNDNNNLIQQNEEVIINLNSHNNQNNISFAPSSTINNNNCVVPNSPSNINASAFRQKSYSSQQAKPNISQRLALNIK